MHRSSRALLQRRALDKDMNGRYRLYKVSLSLVFVLWGLVFLLSLWISYGDDHRDRSTEFPVAVSNKQESGQRSKNTCFEEMPLTERDDLTCSSRDIYQCSLGIGDFGSKMAGGEEGGDDVSIVQELYEVEPSHQGLNSDNSSPSSDRLSHAVPVSLDEFKSKAFGFKTQSTSGNAGSVIHRVEPGGTWYNYASASKGAKVLASNKEAKGASNILSRDKDKYLRNPCSAEEKYVIIELSEETLVSTIEIANFEHYSSNLKEFELLGSLVYPTDTWVSLGNFTATNVKHAQKFPLQEPKWARYLKLNLLSHYGAEFYCTVSVLEVYGVDAVERMLEDLISVPHNSFPSSKGTGDQDDTPSQKKLTRGDDLQDLFDELESESVGKTVASKHEYSKSNVPDPIEEARLQQSNRMPGDTVLKILMQKVHTLDSTLSILERYLEELNMRYGNIFKELDKDIGVKERLTEKLRADISALLDSHEAISKDVAGLASWKSVVSEQLDALVKDNAVLRSDIENVRENQIAMENKGIIVFFTSLAFGLFALMRLFVNMLLSIYISQSTSETEMSRKFCTSESSWLYLLLSCTIIIFILSL